MPCLLSAGRHQSRDHHQYARPLVRPQARHGDQLALNGASFGGITGVPLLVAAIGSFGFSGAMIVAAIVMVVLMVPIILDFGGTAACPFKCHGCSGVSDAPSATRIRAQAFRDLGFLSVSIAFALVLFAQVGFIVHLISFLDSVTGRDRAAFAVAVLTAMAVVGRVLFSTVIDRLNQRLASAISFVSQAVALAIIIIQSAQRHCVIAPARCSGFRSAI